MAKLINKTSDATRFQIKNKSVLTTPNNPYSRGITAEQIKQMFAGIVTDKEYSALSEVDRLADEINNILCRLFVGVYEELPTELSFFEDGDKIILTDGSIHKFEQGKFVKTNIGTTSIETAVGKWFEEVEEKMSKVESQIDNINAVINLREVQISYEEPEDKTEGRLWGKILN